MRHCINESNQRRFHLPFKFCLILLLLLISIVNFTQAQVQIGATSYSTLKAAFDAINAGTHTGAISIQITNNTTETAQAVLNASGIGGANYSSVTIRPSGVSGTSYRTISGSLTVPIININGCTNVTIDGSATVGGTSRNLAVTNSGTDYLGSGCIQAINASSVTIKNVIAYTGSPSYGWGIKLDKTLNATIENCWSYKSNYGIWVYNQCQNVTLRKNLVGSTSSGEYVRFIGIRFGAVSASGSNNGDYSCNGFTIIENEVNGMDNTSLPTDVNGVNVVRGFLIGDAINGSIIRNRLTNVKNSANNSGSGTYAVQMSGYNAAQKNLNVVIANNFISDVRASYSYTTGMLLHSQSNVQVYHNTIDMGTTTATGFSSGLYIHQDVGSLTIKNNIIRNNQPVTSGTSTGIYLVPTASPFTSIDYNNYSVGSTGTNAVAYFNGSYRTALSDWQSAISGEANSQTVNPVFVSSSDLHLDGVSANDSKLLCPLVSTTTYWDGKDIDGETRRSGTGNTTCMGADEVISTINITKNINQLPGPLCEGSPFSLSINAAVTFGDGVQRTASIVYEWYKVGLPDPISGATTNTYTKNPSVYSDNGSYYCRARYSGNSTNSQNSNVTIHGLAMISKQPDQAYYVCEGFPFDYPPTVGTIGTVTNYQWQKENPQTKQWENIQGQNTNTLTIPVNDANAAMGRYRVYVYGGVCNSVPMISNPCMIDVSSPLANPTINMDQGVVPSYICTGSDIKMYANATGTILGYQWEKFEAGFFNPIRNNPTAQTAEFVIENAGQAASGIYRCKIFGNPNCLTPELNSNQIEVTVWNITELLEEPEPQVICYGERFQLQVVTNGDILSYQWQKDGIDIPASENPSAVTPVFQQENSVFEHSGVYRCIVTLRDCRGVIPVPTRNALVYVLTNPEITKQPKDVSGEIGSTAMFEVQAHVYNTGMEIEKYSYQWYLGDINSPLIDDDKYAGTHSSLLSIKNIQQSDMRDDYFAIVTGKCGSTQTENVSILPQPEVIIVAQPKDTSECEGTDATFHCTWFANNAVEDIKYQWYKDGIEIQDGPKYEGTNSFFLKVKGVRYADQGKYHVVLTVIPGYKTVVSEEAELVVKELPLITTQPEASVTVQTGRELNLSVVAIGSGPLYYQWYKGDLILTGETNPNFIIPAVALSDGGTYKVKVWNDCGELFSTEAVVTVQFENISSVEDDLDGIGSLVIMPNPVYAEADIKLEILSEQDIRISLSDMIGKECLLIHEGILRPGVSLFKLNPAEMNLSSGIYNLVFRSGNKILAKQIIISR